MALTAMVMIVEEQKKNRSVATAKEEPISGDGRCAGLLYFKTIICGVLGNLVLIRGRTMYTVRVLLQNLSSGQHGQRRGTVGSVSCLRAPPGAQSSKGSPN